MKIVFVSGFLNNHLLPLCDELSKRSEFFFVATQDWQAKGYNRSAIHSDYVLNYYEEESRPGIERLIKECDIGIFGGSSDALLEIRKQTGKLAFVYTERLFKKGKWRYLLPKVRKVYRHRFMENNQNLFVLCASSYVPEDLKFISFPSERCFKFGYFPKTEVCDLEELLKKKNDKKLELLFVGRLVKLKRVDDILECSRYLKESNIDFIMRIIGDGPEKAHIEKSIKEKGLSASVELLGECSPQIVAQYMQQSSILYFSSNKEEGWGAVVNEALSYGCAVIASDACGSTKYMINDGLNGAVYHVGRPREMFQKTMDFWKSHCKADVYEKAYYTVASLWNAGVAAQRLIELSYGIINQKDVDPFECGPVSRG